jgi:hypothetical protein
MQTATHSVVLDAWTKSIGRVSTHKHRYILLSLFQILACQNVLKIGTEIVVFIRLSFTTSYIMDFYASFGPIV